jgi:hypothetical protein
VFCRQIYDLLSVSDEEIVAKDEESTNSFPNSAGERSGQFAFAPHLDEL